MHSCSLFQHCLNGTMRIFQRITLELHMLKPRVVFVPLTMHFLESHTNMNLSQNRGPPQVHCCSFGVLSNQPQQGFPKKDSQCKWPLELRALMAATCIRQTKDGHAIAFLGIPSISILFRDPIFEKKKPSETQKTRQSVFEKNDG